MFLAHFDPDPQRSITNKIDIAFARYTRKFGKRPVVCLLNPQDFRTFAMEQQQHGMAITARSTTEVGPHSIWIGEDEA